MDIHDRRTAPIVTVHATDLPSDTYDTIDFAYLESTTNLVALVMAGLVAPDP